MPTPTPPPPPPASGTNAPPQPVQLLLLGAVRSRSSGGTSSRRSSSSSRSSSTAGSDAASYSVQSSTAFPPSSTAAIPSARPASPASFQAFVAPSSSPSPFSSPISGSTAIAIGGVGGRHYSSANRYRPLLPGPFEAPADDGEYTAPGHRWQTHYALASLIAAFPATLRRLRSTAYRLTLFAATWLPRNLRAAPRRLGRVFLLFLLPGFLLGVAALSAYMPLREDAPWAITTAGDSAGSGTPPSTAPAPRLAAPSPFSSLGCYLSQLKFLAGTVLFSDRLVDREPCTDRPPSPPAAVALTCPSCLMPISESSFAHAPAALRASAAAVAAFASAHKNGGPPAAVHASVEWITYATSCSMGLRRLEISLDSAGIPLTLLGVHVPWRGWGQRLRAYHDHVAAIAAVDPDRLVVLSDGEDVFFAPVCSAADLVRRFLVLRGLSGAAVIAAAESALWPDESLAKDYNRPNVVHRPPGVRDPRSWARTDVLRTGSPLPIDTTDSKTHAAAGEVESRDILARRGWTYGVPDREWLGPGSPMRHLNAGTLMGRAADVAALLHRVYTDDCIDDQLALTLAYLRPDMHWNEPTAADEGGGEGGGVGGPDDTTLVAAVDLAAWYYSDTELRFGQDSPEAAAARDRLVHATARQAYVSTDRTVAPSAAVARRTLVVAAAGSVHGYPDPGRPRALVAPSAPLLPPPLPRYRLEPSPASLPSRARPLLALDFEADLFVAMFNKTLADFRRGATAGAASPALSSAGTAAAAARHIDARGGDDDDKGGGDLVYARTLGRPCVLHQSGRKVENRVLEELAREFGLPHDDAAIDRAATAVAKIHGVRRD